MSEVTVVVPGPITTRTGGSIYDRRIVEGLKGRGWTVTLVELDSIPHPLAPPLEMAAARFSELREGSTVLVDGLAFGTIPEIVEREAWRLRFVPIVHMALSTTPGLIRGESAWLSNLEGRALKHARRVVITGQRTRPHVRALTGWVDDGLIVRIPPGTDRPAEESAVRASGKPVRLLCVANLTPGKGHDVLLRALSATPGEDWTLTCAGSEQRDPEYAARLRSLTTELGLASRVTWLGELDETGILEAHRDADLFVLATHGETYGMAVADAIAMGLPVVSTRTGEIPSFVGEGGLLAEPNDAEGFAAVLAQALSDPHLRQRLKEGAREAASRLPTWDEAADAMAGRVDEGWRRWVSRCRSGWPFVRTRTLLPDRAVSPACSSTGSKESGRCTFSIWAQARGRTSATLPRNSTSISIGWRSTGIHASSLRRSEAASVAPGVRWTRACWILASSVRQRSSTGVISSPAPRCSIWCRPPGWSGSRQSASGPSACALFTISYNGWNECEPKDAADGSMFALFNLHQLTDKGLGGPAAGPRGTDVARERFADAGFDVHVEASNWHICPDDREFQRQLIDGWGIRRQRDHPPSDSEINRGLETTAPRPRRRRPLGDRGRPLRSRRPDS